MSNLHSESAIVAAKKLYNKPRLFLTPDAAQLPDLAEEKHVKFTLRAPLIPVENERLAIKATVGREYSVVPTHGMVALPKASSMGDPTLPFPPMLDDILRMEPELPLHAALQRASNFPSSVALAFADIEPNPGPPLTKGANYLKRKERTPFPTPHSTTSYESDHSSRKRTRTELPVLDLYTTSNRTFVGLQPIKSAVGQPTVKFDANCLQRATLYPLGYWAVGELYTALAYPQSIDHKHTFDGSTKEKAVLRLTDILLHVKPRVAVIVLSLWYIKRIYSKKFVRAEILTGSHAIELIVRVFALGLSLASKWLDDHAISSNTWLPFISLSLISFNSLEKSALEALGYNISVTAIEWKSWLLTLRQSMAGFSVYEGSSSVPAIIDDLLAPVETAEGFPCQRLANLPVSDLYYKLKSQVMEHLWFAYDDYRPRVDALPRVRRSVPSSAKAPRNPWSAKAADFLTTVVTVRPIRTERETYTRNSDLTVPSLYYYYGSGHHHTVSVG